jgi:hypothetical protein
MPTVLHLQAAGSNTVGASRRRFSVAMGVQTANLLWEFWSTAPVCIFLGKQEMLGLLCNLFFLMCLF